MAMNMCMNLEWMIFFTVDTRYYIFNFIPFVLQGLILWAIFIRIKKVVLSYKTKLKRGIFNVCFPHYFFVILLPISADKKFQENVGNNLKKVYFLSNFITGKGSAYP